MNANTQQLHALGQSLWIDHITRQILDDRTLERYIAELAREGRSGYIEALADRLQPEGADCRVAEVSAGRYCRQDLAIQRSARTVSGTQAIAAHRSSWRSTSAVCSRSTT